MFEQSLLQSAPAHRSRRGMATAISFLLECTLIGVLVLLPLIYTEALPALRYAIDIGPPPSAPPPPPPVEVTSAPPSTSEVIGETVIAPPRIPDHVAHVAEQVAPPPLNPGVAVLGGTGTYDSHSAIASVLSEHPYTPPPPPSPMVSRAPVSGGVMAGYLISQVQPVYPAMAQRARVQGTVVLSAVISQDGRIENLRVLSGHPWLVKAAMDAVQQWRYRPYLLTGQPVEVETQVTVNFMLNGGS